MTRTTSALGPMILQLPPTCLPVCCGCSELLVLHLSPTCPALVSDCLAVCFGFSGPPDSTLVSRLSPTVSQHAVGALDNMTLHLVTGQKIKHYKAQFIYIHNIYIIFVFSVSIFHLIIGVILTYTRLSPVCLRLSPSTVLVLSGQHD